MNSQSLMTDKEIMEDMLSSQKAITGVYNTFSNECSHQNIRDDFLNILRDEHNIQSCIYTEMQKRGWYAPAEAQQPQIDQVKNKFQTISASL
ncbi:MAG: spore coat protein [Clostridia bacterium]|nr:spore coat protein [Clostridia bacterium]